jgi:hypothetical protein
VGIQLNKYVYMWLMGYLHYILLNTFKRSFIIFYNVQLRRCLEASGARKRRPEDLPGISVDIRQVKAPSPEVWNSGYASFRSGAGLPVGILSNHKSQFG